MKKLILDLDELHVESFEPSPLHRDQRGSVAGHGGENGGHESMKGPCFNNTLAQSCWETCAATCETCDYSCDETCAGPTCFADTCVCWTTPRYC